MAMAVLIWTVNPGGTADFSFCFLDLFSQVVGERSVDGAQQLES